MARKKLGEILIEAGLLDDLRLRAALDMQQRSGGKLGRVLLDMKAITEPALVGALAHQLRLPTVDMDQVNPPAAVLGLIPGEYAESHAIIPIAAQGKFLDVAMADPSDLVTVDELQARMRVNVRVHVAGPLMFERALGRLYGRGMAKLRMTARVTAQHSSAVGLANEAEIDLPSGDNAAPAVAKLKEELEQLRAVVMRDDGALRNLLQLLIDKGLVTREELAERLSRK